jgi:ferredoxin
MAAQVIIDEEECISCESCVELCPSVFGWDEDSEKAFVIDGADANEDCVEEAVASCPSECIEVE